MNTKRSGGDSLPTWTILNGHAGTRSPRGPPSHIMWGRPTHVGSHQRPCGELLPMRAVIDEAMWGPPPHMGWHDNHVGTSSPTCPVINIHVGASSPRGLSSNIKWGPPRHVGTHDCHVGTAPARGLAPMACGMSGHPPHVGGQS